MGVPKQNAETFRMTVEEKTGWLSNKQIVRLAASISQPVMEAIALGYLNLIEDIIEGLRKDNWMDPNKFNREILRRWANMNSGPAQVMVGLFGTLVIFIFGGCAG